MERGGAIGRVKVDLHCSFTYFQGMSFSSRDPGAAVFSTNAVPDLPSAYLLLLLCLLEKHTSICRSFLVSRQEHQYPPLAGAPVQQCHSSS